MRCNRAPQPAISEEETEPPTEAPRPGTFALWDLDMTGTSLDGHGKDSLSDGLRHMVVPVGKTVSTGGFTSSAADRFLVGSGFGVGHKDAALACLVLRLSAYRSAAPRDEVHS